MFLEGDDNEAHKDVHHEEGDEDEVNDEEDGDLNAVVVNRANVFQIRVDGFIQQAAHTGAIRKMCFCAKVLGRQFYSISLYMTRFYSNMTMHTCIR